MGGQSFTVKPNGAVHSGSASYTVDPATGIIVYQAQVVVGFWPFYKSQIVGPTTFNVDPALLLPSHWNAADNKVPIGNATFIVQSVNNGVAQVVVSVSTQPSLSIEAMVDLTNPIVDVIKLTALYSVPVFGQLTIEADEVVPNTHRPIKSDFIRFFDWAMKPWDADWKSFPHR